MAEAMEERLRTLTVAQVAERLQVRIRTVYGLIKRGELRAVKIGRVWRVPLEALQEYLTGPAEIQASDAEPVSGEELADIHASLQARERGEHITLEELERKYGL